jgi:hypothetical protein
MKKLTVLALIAALALIAGAGCDNGSGEEPADVTVKVHEGKAIIVRGLRPGDNAVGKIRDVVDLLAGNTSIMGVQFWNYVKEVGLILTVEDVPEYNSDDPTEVFRVIDQDELATRYEYVSTETALNIAKKVLAVVNDMNLQYHVVPITP